MISVISENEASKLLNETRAAPKTPEFYLVQLQVFHDLHCLNLIRKWVYMDVYTDQAEWVDGTLNHGTVNALHVGMQYHRSVGWNLQRLNLWQIIVSTLSDNPLCVQATLHQGNSPLMRMRGSAMSTLPST